MNATTTPMAHPYPYPTIRIGGLWFLWIGVVIILASLLTFGQTFNGPIFALGFILGIGGILINRRVRASLAFGETSKRQRTAMWAGVGLQAVLFIILANGFPNLDPRTFWLAALIIVGIHLFPFSLLHGPRAAFLGVLCIASAVLGVLLIGVPFWVFGVIDGVLKLLFGLWMFTTKPPVQA